MKRRASLLGIGIAALFLIVGCGSSGQTVTHPSGSSEIPGQINAPSLAAPQAPTPAGLGQGIQVHGWWSIDVRDQDGSVRSHTEFENSLWAGQGDLALAGFLGRSNSVGLWDLTVDNAGSGAPYAFIQSHEPAVAGGNLTVTVPAADQTQVVLQGSATSPSAFTAVRVATGVQQCAIATTPGTNCGVGYRAFTAHTLSPGIAVAEGQSVEVKIVFSFS
jgi:hypothetical protein